MAPSAAAIKIVAASGAKRRARASDSEDVQPESSDGAAATSIVSSERTSAGRISSGCGVTGAMIALSSLGASTMAATSAGSGLAAGAGSGLTTGAGSGLTAGAVSAVATGATAATGSGCGNAATVAASILAGSGGSILAGSAGVASADAGASLSGSLTVGSCGGGFGWSPVGLPMRLLPIGFTNR
jgi:hypothetical protein